jgi:hypothetical protein
MTFKKWLETSVWVLIYAGMILVGLGLSAQRQHTQLGWALLGLGFVFVFTGLVLISVRARL